MKIITLIYLLRHGLVGKRNDKKRKLSIYPYQRSQSQDVQKEGHFCTLTLNQEVYLRMKESFLILSVCLPYSGSINNREEKKRKDTMTNL